MKQPENMTRDELLTLVRDQQWGLEHYRKENAALRRKVERLTDMGNALAGDGGMADKYQQERDTLLGFFNMLYRNSQQNLDNATRQVYEVASYVEAEFASHTVPAVAQELWTLFNNIDEFLVAALSQEIENLNLSEDDAVRLVAAAQQNNIMAGVRTISIAVVAEALKNSNVPSYLAHEICRQLENYGEVNPALLDRLGEDFLKNLNLDRAPSSPSTAKRWLDLSEHFRRSGQTQEAFALEANCDRKQIQRAEQLRTALEQTALEMPVAVRERLED